MKTNNHGKKNIIVIVILLSIILTACGQNQKPTPDLIATQASLYLQQTMVALEATAQFLSIEQTRAANPTPTFTPSPIPSPTNTPGPVVINDDFSIDTGRWQKCGQCEIRDGMLIMGPYPATNSAEGYFKYSSIVLRINDSIMNQTPANSLEIKVICILEVHGTN